MDPMEARYWQIRRRRGCATLVILAVVVLTVVWLAVNATPGRWRCDLAEALGQQRTTCTVQDLRGA